MTLIGFTDQRGTAWHHRSDLQGAESNHYPGAIPVEDVNRRLFNFDVNDADVFYKLPGSNPPRFQKVEGRKALVTSDTGEALGIFKDGYQGHGYRPWLLDNVSLLLDDDLGIGSAGLLRNRAQAWVSVEMPENIETPEGVVFRPHLLACTSFDGSLATTYKRTNTFVVCDNTLACGLAERDQTYKLRHTKYSGMKLTDAREALAIVHKMAEDTAEQIANLAGWKVELAMWERHLDAMNPVPDDDGRGKTVALKRRDELTALYVSDPRVAPWTGTALGVLQAYNTYRQHVAITRKGAPKIIRTMENVVMGKSEAEDNRVLEVLAAVAA